MLTQWFYRAGKRKLECPVNVQVLVTIPLILPSLREKNPWKCFDKNVCCGKDLVYSTWNSARCYVAAWMGGEFRGEWIHVYVWLSLFAIYLKTLNSIVNQLYSNTKLKVKKDTKGKNKGND